MSTDVAKADRAEDVVRTGGIISVHVLNEIAKVARRKLAMPWDEINAALEMIRSVCPVVSLTIKIHDRGRSIAERYKLNVYDAMIVAAALLAE